ncbi:MAG: hypothetical protein ABWY06_19280 [Pseudomonas sp.]|uniref:hypothetical protein n=1 Tax=Pseudomonas sp. TaxID=306 RepID=UPI0033989C87
MSCLICGAGAQVLQTGVADWEERECAQCGRYKVAQTLLSTMGDMVFDVDKTRQWIASNSGTGQAPRLSPLYACLVSAEPDANET